jgi:hypothetical protein
MLRRCLIARWMVTWHVLTWFPQLHLCRSLSPILTSFLHWLQVGTYSEGGTFEDCKPCPFGTTSDFGATGKDECRPVAQTCPVGQIARPGAVSSVECGCIPGYGGKRRATAQRWWAKYRQQGVVCNVV